jgi:hypothetical protein
MADNSFSISVDLSGFLSSAGTVLEGVIPQLSLAVRKVTEATSLRWKDAVYKSNLWQGEKAAYIDSIKWKTTGPFSGVIEADYKLASEIESGRPARDLKRMLDTSLKVRISQSKKNAGKRYLIIPFRHNTPGMSALARPMPGDIYSLASALRPSVVFGQTMRNSGTGAWGLKSKAPLQVRQNQYSWGERLPAGLAPKLAPHHATDPYAGMVRMKTNAPGSPRSSAYLTFRLMMEGSPKWIVPAKPGLNIVDGVARDMQPLAEAAFSQAISAATKS